jgi:xanthine dehydrogenase YagT iron-sulfur-binding subunit
MPVFPSPIDVGSPAPDFALSTTTGAPVTHVSLRGHPVVLAFFSSDWDPSRADQLAHYNSLVRQLPGANAELLAISRDGVWCDLKFAGEALRVPVLSGLDPVGTLAASFGVAGEHAVVVLDAEGVVRWIHRGTAVTPDALLRALEGASATAAKAVASWSPDESVPPARSFRTTRRDFVAAALGAAVALAAAPLLARAQPLAARLADPLAPDAVDATAATITLRINGRPVALAIEPRVTLLDALREYAGLTGTKKGCDHGQCGACTVHVNGKRQLSCLSFAMMHQQDEITTVEGLGQGTSLHPMQAAFIKHDGFQCGYCTPGQLMSATALLKEPCGPADADVKECMSGNLCRCGAYPGIVAAIQDVRHNASARS